MFLAAISRQIRTPPLQRDRMYLYLAGEVVPLLIMTRRSVPLGAALVLAAALALPALALPAGASAAAAPAQTTAWRDGRFAENTQGVVSRSDIVLGQPNYAPAQYMALGNGRLGGAPWGGRGAAPPP